MLKKIKFKNSTILLTGIIIISLGISIGLYEYFEERKNKAFSDMNIILFENEQPKNIINSGYVEEPGLNDEQNSQKGPEENETNDESSDNKNQNYNYLGVLEIPKINLKNGFYDLNSRYNNVDYNVTVIKGSTLPDEVNNNLILAAHSGDCPVCYFEKLYKLQLGDMAYIYYNNVKYTYKIVDIYEVEKDGTVAIYRDYSKNVLTLITCTRNSNTKQTVYILEQDI